MKYTYIDRDGVEIECKSEAECARRWRDRYLEDSGLTYKKLVSLKNQMIVLHLHPGRYGDEDVGDSLHYIEIENAVFLPLTVEQVFIKIAFLKESHSQSKSIGSLRVEFVLERFDIPEHCFFGNTLKKVKKLKVFWVGFEAGVEDIWDLDAEMSVNATAKTYKPRIQVQASSCDCFDALSMDTYWINASIELLNRDVVGQ